MTTIRIPASRYEDHDDCLTAAADDVARERNLFGWRLGARWEDDQRDAILVDIPDHAAREGDDVCEDDD